MRGLVSFICASVLLLGVAPALRAQYYSVNIDWKTAAAMQAAYATGAVAEGFYYEQVKDILDHYTAAEAAAAGIFSSKFLERRALTELGIWESSAENWYYRRIYRLVSARTLPPRTISKFRPTRERSMRPFALAFSQPFSVQRRWCSLLWAVVNPLFASKCRTCFCASISCVFLFSFAFLSSVRKLADSPALRYVSAGDMHIELPPSLHIRQNRASPAPKEPIACGGILPLRKKPVSGRSPARRGKSRPGQGRGAAGVSYGLLLALFEPRDGDPYADRGPFRPDDPDLLQALEEGDDRMAVPSPLLGEAGIGDVEPAGPVVRIGLVAGGLPLQQAAEGVEAREAFALGLAEHP